MLPMIQWPASLVIRPTNNNVFDSIMCLNIIALQQLFLSMHRRSSLKRLNIYERHELEESFSIQMKNIGILLDHYITFINSCSIQLSGGRIGQKPRFVPGNWRNPGRRGLRRDQEEKTTTQQMGILCR